MTYVVTFLEGALTFISPCLLPMLPVYFAYLGGGAQPGAGGGKIALNACGFTLGFSIVFILLGAAASTFGAFVKAHTGALNVVCGVFVVLLGLNFAGFLRLPFLNRTRALGAKVPVTGFFTAVLFGAVFSLGWTPCVGAFLGSALMLAATQGGLWKGARLMAVYSLGLGVPFVLSALLFEKLSGAFAFVKRHYRAVNIACGVFLIVLGVFMATGRFNAFVGFFS